MSTTDIDRAVLAVFDALLEQPDHARDDWLAAQDLTDGIRTRIQRLLETERRVGNFLDAPASLAAFDIPDLPRIGERIGNYALVEAIDAGGMGVVFRARRADHAYEQQVAIKFVQPTHLAGNTRLRSQLIARFDDERAILAQLTHPNIARILDGGTTTSGIPYLVMEYVDGVSLTRYCDAQRLGVADRIGVFRKVCAGVQDAHRHLIVHRDLKPENVLVGDDGEPRLLDFGIAKLLDAPGSVTGATALTAMTPAYASPEQVRHEPLTTTSDVYSLGVMLFQLIAGARPYELDGLSPAQAERVVSDASAPSLRTVLASAQTPVADQRQRIDDIGDDLERVVARAMHKDPARRYASAQALSDDLAAYLDKRPVTARVDTQWYRMQRFLQRHRLASAAASLALLAIVAAAGIAIWQARQAQQAVADADQINRFLIDVLGTADAYTTGTELTLNETLDDAASKIDARFAHRPDLSAGVRLAIGNSLANRDRLDEADPILQRALADSRLAHGDDDLRTLRVIESIALLRSYQSRYDESTSMFQEVLARLEATGQSRDPLFAIALNDFSYVYLFQEDYERALPLVRRAVALFEIEHVDVPAADRASMLSNLAQALDGTGKPQDAVAPYERAFAIQEALFPDGSPNSAILLNNWALLARNLGDREKSLELLQQSSDMRKRLFKSAHPLIVRGLTNVARQALELDRVDLALASAREAVDTGDRAFTKAHAYQVLALAVLAESLARHADAAAAANALVRAEVELAALDEPIASVTDYVRNVRSMACAAPSALGQACDPQDRPVPGSSP